jgi:AcrR family transcriptional regulator
VTIADVEGLDAVTVRRLAAALGVHFSSLYTHVASKEAILDGMVEQLLDEANIADPEDWRAWVRSFAAAMRRLARAHPGAFLVLTRRPALGPLATRQAEGALAAFRRGGFGMADAAAAVAGTSLAVLGLALNECLAGPVGVTAGVPDLAHLSAAEFPNMVEAAALTADSGPTWAVMVESLITGLAARVKP